MVRVIFSSTYDIQNYHISHISAEEFKRLEALRGDASWIETDPIGGGYFETYHGPAA